MYLYLSLSMEALVQFHSVQHANSLLFLFNFYVLLFSTTYCRFTVTIRLMHCSKLTDPCICVKGWMRNTLQRTLLSLKQRQKHYLKCVPFHMSSWQSNAPDENVHSVSKEEDKHLCLKCACLQHACAHWFTHPLTKSYSFITSYRD